MLAALYLPSAGASSPVTEIHTGDIAKGTVGLGMGLRWGDSPYTGVDDIGHWYNDEPSDLMPFYYYEGRWLFSHGSSAGIHFLDSEHFELDALISYRFSRLEPQKDWSLRGLEEREQSLDGGLRAAFKGDWGKLSATALTDTLDRHGGDELDITYRFDWAPGKWMVSPFASYVWQDENLTNYYYGVSEEERRFDQR